MNWTQAISQWRNLSPTEKLRRRWEAIPVDVAQSMAFEREPVTLSTLQELHARTTPPAILRTLAESSPPAR